MRPHNNDVPLLVIPDEVVLAREAGRPVQGRSSRLTPRRDVLRAKRGERLGDADTVGVHSNHLLSHWVDEKSGHFCCCRHADRISVTKPLAIRVDLQEIMISLTIYREI